MAKEITYTIFTNGLGFNADCDGRHVGEITFVRSGLDKFIIDHTAVDGEFQNTGVGLDLVRHVCELARNQHRKVIPLCPFAAAMFRRYSEFDDIRFYHTR